MRVDDVVLVAPRPLEERNVVRVRPWQPFECFPLDDVREAQGADLEARCPRIRCADLVAERFAEAVGLVRPRRRVVGEGQRLRQKRAGVVRPAHRKRARRQHDARRAGVRRGLEHSHRRRDIIDEEIHGSRVLEANDIRTFESLAQRRVDSWWGSTRRTRERRRVHDDVAARQAEAAGREVRGLRDFIASNYVQSCYHLDSRVLFQRF